MMRTVLLGALLVSVGGLSTYGNDVTVTYSRGDVLIKGDDNANSIEIRRVGFSYHEFRGLNGTRINGGTEPLILPIFDDLSVLMERGNDTVLIRSLRLMESAEANLLIKLGEGDDHLTVENGNMTGYLSIVCNSSNEDNDFVKVAYTVADFADIQTQDYSEVVLLYNEFGLFLDTGRSGADDVTIMGNTLGHVIEIDLSDDDDTIMFYGNYVSPSYWNGIRLHGGDDVANFWMEFYHFDFFVPWPLRVFAGTGFDQMTRKGSRRVEPYGFDEVGN